jgi:hypothetical protein
MGNSTRENDFKRAIILFVDFKRAIILFVNETSALSSKGKWSHKGRSTRREKIKEKARQQDQEES